MSSFYGGLAYLLGTLQFSEDTNKHINRVIHLIYYIWIPKKPLTDWETRKETKLSWKKAERFSQELIYD